MRKSILAIDIEVHMVRLLEKIIRDKTRHQIKTTHNALEVPEILENESFDIIISELSMPGFNGYDLLDELKRRKRNDSVIIMSSENNVEKIIEAFRRGACDVVVKPFKTDQLFEVIERAIVLGEQKKYSCCMSEMMEAQPLDSAVERFKKEYIRYLREKMGNNLGKIAEYTGLTRQEVEQLLRTEDV